MLQPLDYGASILETTALVPLAFKRQIFQTDSIYRDVRPHGETIAEMVRSVPGLPDAFHERGVVCINGEPVARQMWARVRPHATHPCHPIAVTMHLPPRGGGGEDGGGKSTVGTVLGIIAAIAVIAISAGALGPAGLGILGASFAAGGLGAALLGGAVGLAASLAISALTPPPAVQPSLTREAPSSEEAKESASAEGNLIAPGGPVPRVIGTRKVFPSLAGDPITELVDDDEYVTAVYVLNGPHNLDEIRVGDSEIAEAEDIEYQLREGWTDDVAIDLVTRQGRTSTPQIELSAHQVSSEDQKKLKHTTTPTRDLPVYHTVSTRNGPDEVWLHLLLPQGIAKNADTTNDKTIPFRLSMRRRGDPDWINFPEIHLSDRTVSQRRKAILLKWDQEVPDIPIVPSKKGWVMADITVPGQAADPITAGWSAHAYFNNGTGSTPVLYQGTETSTQVDNTLLYDNRVEFYLDSATFPRGIYDIRIKRGSAFDSSSLVKDTYTYSGSIVDFFEYSNVTDPQIPMGRENISDQVYLVRVTSIWNEHPIPIPGFAIIAIKARNRRIENVSALASGYVQDWDGTGWNTWTTTSNPAPHYVDALSGRLNADPLPADLRDDETLTAWRTLCTANDWTCDSIADDIRTQDLLQLLASCGYARPYQSELYGVTIDQDVSAEAPSQVFTPRNSASFSWQRAFPRLPDGFVVTFRDAADDYNDAQEIVYRTGYEGGEGGLLESITYDGLVDRTKVIARAKFDLDQAEQRASFYNINVDAEAFLSRRGDLVAFQHDTIIKRTSAARIRTRVLSGSNITGLVLDSEIPVVNEPYVDAIVDVSEVTDMSLVGLKTNIVIRGKDGTLSTHVLSTATDETATVTLATPVADTGNIEGFDDSADRSGSLVIAGDAGSEYRRCLISAIKPGPDMTFAVTLVDEAPELVRG